MRPAALLVRSLEKTGRFYTEVLGFEPIYNGTHQDNIRWFGIGGLTSLHVTEADFGRTHLEKQTHFAVSVEDFDGFVEKLRRLGVTFYDWPGNANAVTARPDGCRQIYLRDPDDYLVEVNDHVRERA